VLRRASRILLFVLFVGLICWRPLNSVTASDNATLTFDAFHVVSTGRQIAFFNLFAGTSCNETGSSVCDAIGITVVVPSYNHGRFIDAAIRSLLDQNYPNLQIIVVDGGSNDDTVERLRAYGVRISWTSERDQGQNDAIIKGFARASKDWFAWLNSDDIQCDRALWRVNDAVRANPAVEVVVGGGHYMADDGSFLRRYPTIPIAKDTDLKREFFERGYVAQPSVFFAKDLYERVGGLSRSVDFCMDYELWCRFALANARFVKIESDLSGNRWYETTKTSAQLLELLAEVAATQRKLFSAVSQYYVQAISDYLYSVLHARRFGHGNQLLWRWLYFKCVWVWLNLPHPGYCVIGLFTKTIAKTGPLEDDFLTWRDIWRTMRRLPGRLRKRHKRTRGRSRR
jgi:glycosyltransferase involved in cell wall biosynthesis